MRDEQVSNIIIFYLTLTRVVFECRNSYIYIKYATDLTLTRVVFELLGGIYYG